MNEKIREKWIDGIRLLDVGPDDWVDEYDVENIKDSSVVISNYENLGYEGTGIALVKTKNDKWYWNSLSHCSCYGPWENWGQSERFGTVGECVASITDKYERKELTEEMISLAKTFE